MCRIHHNISFSKKPDKVVRMSFVGELTFLIHIPTYKKLTPERRQVISRDFIEFSKKASSAWRVANSLRASTSMDCSHWDSNSSDARNLLISCSDDLKASLKNVTSFEKLPNSRETKGKQGSSRFAWWENSPFLPTHHYPNEQKRKSSQAAHSCQHK